MQFLAGAWLASWLDDDINYARRNEKEQCLFVPVTKIRWSSKAALPTWKKTPPGIFFKAKQCNLLAKWGVFALRALADGIGLLSVAVLRLSSVCSLTGLSVHLVWLDVYVCSVWLGSWLTCLRCLVQFGILGLLGLIGLSGLLGLIGPLGLFNTVRCVFAQRVS